MEINTAAERYIELCFEVEKHKPGVVDAYFGPPALREQVMSAELRPLEEIIRALDDLAASEALSPAMGRRETFLAKQIRALQTIAERESGSSIPYLEEVSRIYDIRPSKVSESEYRESIRQIDTLVPGTGVLAGRLEEYRKTFEIPTDQILPVFAEALEFTRTRTKSFLQLPAHENFEVTLVENKPWSGYNWFHGNARSSIEINIDLPRRIDHVLHLMSHEGYPGHHTDGSIKEAELYQEQGCLEYSIHPLFSPQSVIAEGIAELAGEIIYSKEEALEYARERIVPKLGRGALDIERLAEINSALESLKSVAANASILLFEEGATEEEAYDYLREFGLLDSGYARKRLEFLKVYRGYIFTYHYGYDLLKRFMHGKDSKAEFARILVEPSYPSMFELA